MRQVSPLSGGGIVSMIDEVSTKVQANPAQVPGFPILNFIALSDLGGTAPGGD